MAKHVIFFVFVAKFNLLAIYFFQFSILFYFLKKTSRDLCIGFLSFSQKRARFPSSASFLIAFFFVSNLALFFKVAKHMRFFGFSG
jgi:hypothetical protein